MIVILSPDMQSRMANATRYGMEGNGIMVPSSDMPCFSIMPRPPHYCPGEGAAASGRGRDFDAARHCLGAPGAGEWSRVISSRVGWGQIERW